ncbi:EbsA family protein [Lactiplantibacillus sp. WILCCON 0030]|uniref:EbsA family protein n=1 Tax=Lactiplantibacillus brownii TaxID=3069269 RepID=A0ABU1AA78_9LACO|nr:EbsA family protein [Lactiplantibacillus brownii]MDQ7937342.1 EbsA family protein [Lactiplantibacillus brownii]
MNNSKHTFKYQPNLASSLIVWSWTLLILMVGIVWWLETLKFKWPLALIFGIFIVVSAAQIGLRRVTIDRNLMIFSTVFNRSWLVIPRDQLELITAVKGGVQVRIDGNDYQFLMPKKSRNQLINLAQNN